MVLNVTWVQKAFRAPVMFARKFDPVLYPDAMAAWDRWMAGKLISQSTASGQAQLAENLLEDDPHLVRGIPPPTEYENDDPLPPELDFSIEAARKIEAAQSRWRELANEEAEVEGYLRYPVLCTLIVVILGGSYYFCCRPRRKSRIVRIVEKHHGTKLV